MPTSGETVVLVTRDPVLVSSFTARMTMAGEHLITLPELNALKVDEEARFEATLIVDANLLSNAHARWEEELRGHGWLGSLIILVDNMIPGYRRLPGITVLEKSGGSSALLAVLATRRTRS